MDGQIHINNPQDVMEHIAREVGFLNEYATLLVEESKNIQSLENLVSETKQSLVKKKNSLYIAIEQTKKQEDSEAKRQALSNLEKKLSQYERQERLLSACSQDLSGIKQDFTAIINESATIADNGRKLSGKVKVLIEKIIQTL